IRQRSLARSTRRRSDMFGSTVVSQYLVGLASPLGHSMSSVSSAKRASPRIGAARTRTRAKRDRSFTLVPFPPRDGSPGALRQAGMMVGDRQRHRHLAIGLLAELPAILMMHTYRMPALLGKRRIVDDPGFDRAAPRHLRHYLFAHFGQHLLIRPRGVGDEVQELLMLHLNVRRIRHHRDRLHAAPAFRPEQPRAIIPQRFRPVGMPDCLRQFTKVSRQTIRDLRSAIETHPSLPLIGTSTTI